LYSDYVISPDGRLNYNKNVPTDLYNSHDLSIDICAIAGKNGSGKSTIVELILMAINNVAYHLRLKEDLEIVEGLSVVLYLVHKSHYKITVHGENISVQVFTKDGLLEEDAAAGHLNVDRLKGLFYTICMNYSHYAYNSRDYIKQGHKDWLSPLFHKNDAYQTPLVINPWRDNGDIIINRENALVKARMITNLLRPPTSQGYNFRSIGENHIAYALKLEINSSKVFDHVLYRKRVEGDGLKKGEEVPVFYRDLKKIQKEIILKNINKEFPFGYDQYKIKTSSINRLAIEYLIRKLISISVRYPEYSGYFIEEDEDFRYDILPKYIKDITRDRTHIGFKFRQTLNFLKYQHISTNLEDNTLDILSERIQTIIKRKKNNRDEIIELIPPPIFSVDISIRSTNGNGDDINFTTLSSGEKQMVYSLSTTLYHLYNLDSVSPRSKKKIKYNSVFIVFEEIELYFHPEMQRRYVKFLRESLINLGLKKIRAISICFVTHSPFILSDIPNRNILFLQLKKGKSFQLVDSPYTFASNIHDLLADAFFMEEGVCGAFAIESVNQTIRFLNNNIRKKQIEDEIAITSQENGLRLMSELKLINIELKNENSSDHLLFIGNIGEPIIKKKLIEMYNRAFPDKSHNEFILAEIERLQKMLK